MRKIIAALQTSVDGFIEDPNGELDWVIKRWADSADRIVVSRTLESVEWNGTRIVRDLEGIRQLKNERGKDVHIVGGATLVSSLMMPA